MHRVIGERDLDATPFSEALARELLREMVRVRVFDERAVALQRRGWMSGYPPFRGQEASQVAAAHAMHEDDWLFPTYRANAMQLVRGVPMADILLFRRGYPEYNSDHDVPNAPQTIPIATQIPHAVGAGMAAGYRGTDDVAVAYFGDGATSEGDFHEAMNFAGVFGAPVLFLCENNGWAISMPEERQTAAATIAGKADAYGFRGGRVDGTDPLAVREFVGSALERTRNGEPVLVESLTYRQAAHTTSDDPSRYEDRAEFPEWRRRDPVERYEEYLREQGVVDEGFVEEVRETADEEVSEAVERAEAASEPDPSDVFDHAYAEATPEQERQRAWLDGFLAEHGEAWREN